MVARWTLDRVVRARDLAGVMLGKILYSYSASLHPGVQMDTGEFNAGG